MLQPNYPPLDIEITDPAVEATLIVLTVSAELASRLRAETEVIADETRQILNANLALMVTPASSQKDAQDAVALARRWRL